MRLFRANLGKLRRRPASWVTLILVIALQALVTLLLVVATRQVQDVQAAMASRMFLTFPNAYELILSMTLGIGGLLAVAYGGAVGGAEWGWGTLKMAVARGESRSGYTVAGYLATAVVTCVGVVIAFLAAVAVSAVGAAVTGAPLSGMLDGEGLARLPEPFLRAFLAMSMNVALGFAIATIARSQLAGIAVGIGVFFVEGIARVFLPDVIKWFPFAASGAVTSGTFGSGTVTGTGFTAALDQNTAIMVTLAWLVGSVAVAAIWTERAEIGG